VQANSKAVVAVRGMLGRVSVDLSFVLYIAANVCYIAGGYLRHSTHASGYKLLAKTANSFGVLSLLNLALFLIPVAKHTPLLKALHVPLEIAIDWHRLAGTLAIYTAAIHGTMFLLKWALLGNNLVTKLFPPMVCFRGSKVSGVGEDSCYGLLRNLLGLIAVMAFVGILITSTEWMRRQHYRVFYVCHVALAPLAFVSVVLHWNKTLLYILPSITLYAISVSLSFWHTVRNHLRGPDGTTVAFHRISHDITEITVSMDEESPAPLPMQWVRLKKIPPLGLQLLRISCIPRGVIGSMSPYHPFSVCSTDPIASTFTVLFRSSGPFTTSLAQSTRCVVEGFHGSVDRTQQMHAHHQVVLVAGGIGVTPFVYTLQALARQGALPGSCLREVQLIWAVRDSALEAYIVPLLEQACVENSTSNFKVSVIVYKTGGGCGKGDDDLDVATLIPIGVGAAEHHRARSSGHALKMRERGGGHMPQNPTDATTVHAALPRRLDTLLFEPSQLAVMTAGSHLQKAVVLVFYFLAMAAAAFLTWEFWLHAQEKHAVVSRIYALVAVWVTTLLFAFLFVAFAKQSPESQLGNHRRGLDEEQMGLCGSHQLDESVATELGITADELKDRAETSQRVPGAESERIHYREGRPSFEALAHGHGDTAVFVCGPKQMVSGVREAASSIHRSWSCCSAGAEVTFQTARKRVTVYEETFSW